MAKRVIFLDIDGVLATKQEYLEIGDGFLPRFRAEAVKLLKGVVEKNSLEIVISSAWRRFPNWETVIRRNFAEAGWWKPQPPIIGRTPLLSGDCCRGVEIQSWLQGRAPGSVEYAILDDDSDMQPRQMPRFVKCVAERGLTKEEAEKLDQLFNTRTEAQRG